MYEKEKRVDLLDKLDEIKSIMNVVEIDVHKDAAGVVSAGVRSRIGLRMLRSMINELLKMTMSNDRNIVEIRKKRRLLRAAKTTKKGVKNVGR